ncbi:MAG: hypothetical protein KAG53_05485 [Endozoicomonadaceae bacterium]|nr:hypothetical protein [Endozoicomonadaceae bacterium]
MSEAYGRLKVDVISRLMMVKICLSSPSKKVFGADPYFAQENHNELIVGQYLSKDSELDNVTVKVIVLIQK